MQLHAERVVPGTADSMDACLGFGLNFDQKRKEIFSWAWGSHRALNSCPCALATGRNAILANCLQCMECGGYIPEIDMSLQPEVQPEVHEGNCQTGAMFYFSDALETSRGRIEIHRSQLGPLVE